MKIQFQLEPRESKFLKDQFLKSIMSVMGKKVRVEGERLEVEERDEELFVRMLKNAGVRYVRLSESTLDSLSAT